MRKQIAAANWKMNLTLNEANELLDAIVTENIQLLPGQEAVFAVPFAYLILAKNKLENSNNFFVAAQNCYIKESGAYTGEMSAPMLASCHIHYVIIGHSERREYFNENNFILSQKIDVCLKNNLKPIFCCGESLAIREGGTQNDYVETQLKESLLHLDANEIRDFVIAYEPIWAIGTGKTATADQAQEMHAHIRKILSDKYGDDIAQTVSILYGGSVKAANAKEIFSKPDVDGGLVGGASLNANEFTQIIKSLKS
jgi:triosephosphate isomerase